MKQNKNPNDEMDDLLDRVVQELRNQPVPSLPPELRDFTTESVTENRSRKRVPLAVSLLAVAAAAVLIASATYLVHHGQSDQNQVAEVTKKSNLADRRRQVRDVDADQIVLMELSSSPVLHAMDAGLDDLNEEIGGLRRQAKLLDARRRAAELTSSLAMLD